MNLTFTAEQDELRRSVRRFLAETSPSTEVRRLMDDELGYDPAVWRRLADELGLAGLAIPEEYGGAGFTLVELGIVLEEAGRALLAAPLLASAGFAASALLAVGDTAANTNYLPGIAAGETIATLGLAGVDGRFDLATPGATATQDGPDGPDGSDGPGAGGSDVGGGAAQGWRLSGTVSYVPDGTAATLLLVIARGPAGPALFAVTDLDGPAVTRRRLAAVDRTRPLARIDLDAAPARLVGPAQGAGDALARALDLGTIALAHEQAGGADRCLEMIVDYARVREQFNRPIGSFQAIKHRCADLLVAVESARSAAYYAAGAAADDAPDVAVAAALAAAFCGEAYSLASRENVQLHGGIGYTWEHDAHLYLKRAASSQLLFGTSDDARDRFADLAGI